MCAFHIYGGTGLLAKCHTTNSKRKRKMDNCHLLVANFRGSRLLTIRVNGQITAAAQSVVPYQRSSDDLVNRMEQLRQDVCTGDFRVCAVKVINELKQIEKKLKNQKIGINVAKTIITGQGRLRCCIMPHPLGTRWRRRRRHCRYRHHDHVLR